MGKREKRRETRATPPSGVHPKTKWGGVVSGSQPQQLMSRTPQHMVAFSGHHIRIVLADLAVSKASNVGRDRVFTPSGVAVRPGSEGALSPRKANVGRLRLFNGPKPSPPFTAAFVALRPVPSLAAAATRYGGHGRPSFRVFENSLRVGILPFGRSPRVPPPPRAFRAFPTF